MQFKVTGSEGASVKVEAPNWMVAIGKAMALLDIDPDAMGRWVCVPQAGGEVFVDDPVTKRSWSITPEAAPTVVVSSASAAEAPDDHLDDDAVDDADDEAAAGPPPAFVMPGAQIGRPVTPEGQGSGAGADDAPSADAEPDAASDAAVTPEPASDAAVTPDAPWDDAVASDAAVTPDAPCDDAVASDGAVTPDAADAPPAPSADAPPAPSADAPPDDLAERLFDLSFDLAGAEPDTACRMALDLVLGFVPCEAASVLRGTLNDDALTFVAATGPVADTLIGRRVPFGTGLVGLCFDLGFPIEVQDVAHDERHHDAIDQETGFSTREALCVPVRDEAGATHGVIQLLNPPRGFADWHVEAVVTVGRSLAGVFGA